MGYNLVTACHRCKVQVYHMRGKENELILPFYVEHSKCAQINLNNVVTVMDNNGTDQTWQPGNEWPYLILNEGWVDEKYYLNLKK